ncbi:MAG TPA: DUF1614 domain-containing protein [Methanocorpusculum sp.]|nr:DUF1614 domain-containing protein [Methanocorpusculum sp.]
MSRFFFSPLSPLFLILLIALVILGLPLLFFGFIGTALAHLGINFWTIVLLLFAVIIGSFINIPLTTLRPKQKKETASPRKPKGQYAPSMYDKIYRSERFDLTASQRSAEEKPGTKISINIGGCLIPVCISVYVIIQGATGALSADPFYLLRILGGVIAVTALTYFLAKPVKNIGIALPFFAAPLMAVACGLLLGGGFGLPAAGIAFVSGTLGTLIGADLLHLKDLPSEGSGILSIGGAGTFDGIFLAGIIAAFLTAF